jgi:NAD(P)-dependent dehydrogenase (short-subunit alcohol dehydrogenase family)
VRRFAGKTAIVTGAGQGIGEAIARRIAGEGGTIVLAEIDRKLGPETAAAIAAKTGATARFIPTDVSDPQSVDAMVAETVATLGPPDILVNNAGIAVFGDPLSITDADWARCMSVDLDGAWLCARAVLPGMRAARRGAIVNIASVHSFQVLKGAFPYGVAKHGVVGLTRALAIEYAAEGIRCNAVCPGTVDTPSLQGRIAAFADPVQAKKDFIARQPMGRLGGVDDITPILVYLASDESVFATGQAFVVDGGIMI